MTATIHKLRRPSPAKYECSACGATVDAACDCGVGYVPAGDKAVKGIAANPNKSNRAIGDQIGVSRETVRRARNSTGTPVPVEKRIGKDGKARRLPQPKSSHPDAKKKAQHVPVDTASDPIQESCHDCDTPEQYWQRSASNLASDAIAMQAFWTRQFGKWQKFKVTSELVTLANEAAKSWKQVADDLKKRRL